MRLGGLKDRLPFWSRQQAALDVRSINLISRSRRLLQTLVIRSVSGIWSNSHLGIFFTRSCSTTTQDLDWMLQAQKPLDKNSVDNVYLVIQYSFPK